MLVESWRLLEGSSYEVSCVLCCAVYFLVMSTLVFVLVGLAYSLLVTSLRLSCMNDVKN